jgi:hypothetical protein
MSYQKTDKEIEEESNQLLQNVEQGTGGWRVVGGIKDLRTTE